MPAADNSFLMAIHYTHRNYLNLEDVETINNFTRLQQQYYGDKMTLQSIESLGSSETLDMYKKLSEAPRRFKSQGSRISF